MKQIIDNIFKEYSQKIETLISSLFTFNKATDSSIQKYNNILRNNENNFYNNNFDNQNNYYHPNNFRDLNSFLNDLTSSVNSALSQSVIDLTNCFICLSPAQDPLTCPKCNNFGCKKCLESYFGYSYRKPCPICKQFITLNELKQNIVIKEIEEIINKNTSKKDKFKELSELILRKKQTFQDQAINSNNILERMLKYQEALKSYREEYNNFLLQMKQIIDNIFKENFQKIENLINSLLSFNKAADTSIQRYNDLYRNNNNNFYNNNIKSLINDILSLERMKFNYNHTDTEKFLNSSISLVPSINIYHLKDQFLKIVNVDQSGYKYCTGFHFRIGDYELKYNYVPSEMGWNNKLIFTLRDDTKKMCFLITQILLINNKETMYPMKFVTQDGKTYTYECKILIDELRNGATYKVKTNVIIFSV
jgi:hypothetical protein